MSLLKTGVYANATTPLFALPGSGGGGGSTLQSPASITPDGTGAAALSVLSTGGADAAIIVGNGNAGNQSADIAMVNGGSGASTIRMGYVKLSQQAFSGALTVSNSISALTPFSVDTVGNAVGVGAAGGTVSVNAPLTLAAPSKATFTPQTVTSTGGSWIAGDNTIALGGFGRGMYVIYGDTGGSTAAIDLESRVNSIFVIDPAQTVSGGGGGADTNWNMSPNGTGGLTLNLVNAPTSAFSMKVMPLYLF